MERPAARRRAQRAKPYVRRTARSSRPLPAGELRLDALVLRLLVARAAVGAGVAAVARTVLPELAAARVARLIMGHLRGRRDRRNDPRRQAEQGERRGSDQCAP